MANKGASSSRLSRTDGGSWSRTPGNTTNQAKRQKLMEEPRTSMECERNARDEWSLEYEMNNRKRGLALIFNQETFNIPGKSVMERRGTNVDKLRLNERFQALGFDVKVHDNKNKQEMMDELRKAAEMDHSDSDCFVCIILSHGEEDYIFASDDKVEIQAVTDLFRGTNCESLVGKPKIFIIQACAGKKIDKPVTGMAGGDSSDEEDEIKFYTLPAGADFLMCNAVVKGFAAFRHSAEGSLYIQDLCETLKEHGSTLEFTELLTWVNLKVSRRNIYYKQLESKQMPCFTSMLTKKLYFRPNTNMPKVQSCDLNTYHASRTVK